MRSVSLKNKLNRLQSHMSHTTEKKVEVEQKSPSVFPFQDVWQQHHVSPYHDIEGSTCLIREIHYPLDYLHGNYRFQELYKVIEKWNETTECHPLTARGHQAEDLFFFDTETTGLGGGVGNTIFLLGYASVSRKGVTLKQHILPDPGGEIALYKSFLESIDYTTMVTYNGKAFDWPQLQTRHTLIREHLPKLPPFGHFDLYHASRRLWKHKLERTKLSIVEREVLGVKREDDIPGYLAPMIYFDYLDTKNPEGMLGIIKHNEIDILSLITLYIHLSNQLLGLDKEQTTREAYETARWFSSIGEIKKAQEGYEELAQMNDVAGIKAKHQLAWQLKKKKQWGKAAELWQMVSSDGDDQEKFSACVELAKIYEHRLPDLMRAIQYTDKALKQIETKEKYKKHKESLYKRRERLLRKLQKRIHQDE